MRIRFFLLIVFIPHYLYASESAISFSVATAKLPPFVYLDADKQPKGILIEILEKAKQETDLEINILVLPWARALDEVKNGRIDALMPAIWTSQREQFFVYPSLSFFTFSDSVLIKRIDDQFVFEGLASIGPNKVIGKTRLVVINHEFDALEKLGQLSTYETTKLDDALLMLTQKKIDLVAGDRAIALSTIRNLNLEKSLKLYALEATSNSSYIAFSQQFAAKHDINYIMQLIMDSQSTDK